LFTAHPAKCFCALHQIAAACLRQIEIVQFEPRNLPLSCWRLGLGSVLVLI